MKSIMKKILTLLPVSLLFIGCDDVSDDSFEQSISSSNSDNLLVQDDYSFTKQGEPVVIYFLKNDVIPTNHSLYLSNPLNGSFDQQSGYLSSQENNIPQEHIIYIPNEEFVGKDSIFYEICNNESYCQQGYIYIMVYESNECDLKNIPDVLYVKTLEENTKDLYTVDLTDIICPLDKFVQHDEINIQGQLFLVNELSPNKFSIQYKSPESVYGKEIVEELDITFCSGIDECTSTKVIYTTLPKKIEPCEKWEANDDSYTYELFSNSEISMKIPSSDLFANDDLCSDLEPKLSIAREPKYGKIGFSGGFITYTPNIEHQSDDFKYKVCNVSGQCTEAEVKILNK